jgi:hypothetical protein
VQAGLHRVLVAGQHASGSQCCQIGYHGTIRNDRLADRLWSHEGIQSGAGTFDRGGRFEATTDQQYSGLITWELADRFPKVVSLSNSKGIVSRWEMACAVTEPVVLTGLL